MILVVGGAGYIGSHCLYALRNEDIDAIAFDNLSQGHRESVGSTPLIVGDILNTADLEHVFANHEIDVVMHFAASISVGESVREPAKYWHNNVLGVHNVLDAMRKHSVKKFVFSSTAAIFGEPEQVPIDEAHGKAPVNPYGQTKLTVERMLSDYDTAYGLKSVCLRYFNAAGAAPDGSIGEDHEPEEHLVPLAIRAAQGLRPALKVFGSDYPTPDGSCVRDYIHVLDIASAHMMAAKHLQSGGDSRAYNLGNGQGYSVKQVIDVVGKVTGLPVPHEMADRRPGDPAVLVASSAKIRTDWGWQPNYPELEQIVNTAWTWHKSHPTGYSKAV